MILGIGNDIIEIERVKKACLKQTFFTRCFTEKEQQLIKDNYTRAAGNFCVKESVAKAFGTGFTTFALKDIEVLRDEKGKPYVNLYGEAKKIYDNMGGRNIYVSISNIKELASAVAVIEN